VHKIDIYVISKKDEKCYEEITNEFIKMSKKYGDIKVNQIFNKKINQAQSCDELSAKKSYSNALEPYLKNGFNIVLDPNGKELDSFEFSEVIKKSPKINFFIGGAYGFENEFLKKCDMTISLSKLTFSHKLAKIVLLEQIFRAFTIINAHPYHK